MRDAKLWFNYSDLQDTLIGGGGGGVKVKDIFLSLWLQAYSV